MLDEVSGSVSVPFSARWEVRSLKKIEGLSQTCRGYDQSRTTSYDSYLIPNSRYVHVSEILRADEPFIRTE